MKFEIELDNEEQQIIFMDKMKEFLVKDEVKVFTFEPETRTFDFIDIFEGINIYFDIDKCFYITDNRYGISTNDAPILKNHLATFEKKKFSDLKVGDIWAYYIDCNEPTDFNYVIAKNKDFLICQYLTYDEDIYRLDSVDIDVDSVSQNVWVCRK
jgi:hypothetical protein